MNALDLQRLAHRLHRGRVPVLPNLLRRAVQVVFSSVLPPELHVGEGTQLGYGGLGVVIHGDARIGRYCLIAQQVTIGGRSGHDGAPRLGDCVLVGAGAKVLGPIAIGDGAVIGANAVVVDDVPAGAVVGGIPARPLATSAAAREAFRREMREHFGIELPTGPAAARVSG
jgi:serine O-acetyltransferase